MSERRRPVAITETTRSEQETGEDEEIGVDDPLELPGRGTELSRQAGERNVDDRAIEHGDEDREAQHGKREPSPSMDPLGPGLLVALTIAVR